MLCGGKYYIEFDENDKNGLQATYNLDSSFFEALSQSEIASGNLQATVSLKPQGSVFSLSLDINGSADVVCDRCLELVSLPVSTQADYEIAFGEQAQELENRIILQNGEQGIDLAWYIYEAIVLALPTHRVHPDGECNGDMNELLQSYENGGSDNGNDEDDIDPRWEALKNIK